VAGERSRRALLPPGNRLGANVEHAGQRLLAVAERFPPRRKISSWRHILTVVAVANQFCVMSRKRMES
jgi:hypothetical protein